MKKYTITIICICLFTCSSIGQSPLNKLVDRIYELKQISEDKQNCIRTLTEENKNLLNANQAQKLENKELDKIIIAKIQEICRVRREISKLRHEYDEMLLVFKNLEDGNEQLKLNIQELKQEKVYVLEQLLQTSKLIALLVLRLENANQENEFLRTKDKEP